MNWSALALAFGMYAAPPADRLPLSRLAPARITPNLCVLQYPVATTSADCQKHFDQGLAYFYSYVWMEAARSFETAASCDPNCALAWWGMSRALEKWDGHDAQHKQALERAKALLPHAAHHEQQLIKARLVEFGMIDPPPPTKLTQSGPASTSPHNEGATASNESDRQKRRRSAARLLDELLVIHDDDEEAWFARAQFADGPGRVPYYKSLLRVNPLHPGALHELVHFYESARRPALGFPYAEKYIESSPGLPHAWHMQAHLATRLGKWDQTSDRSARAVELERGYLKTMNVKAADDHQFSHHLETLTVSLIHDGRFREARQCMADAKELGFEHREAWFRLFLAERDWDAAATIATHTKRHDKKLGAYFAALVHLARGDGDRAAPEIDILQEASPRRGKESKGNYRLWETQGLLFCLRGEIDDGLKLLERAAQKSKDDYSHHAWGNGATLMEVWGQAALAAGRTEIAEEAFLEALAHDPGSVKAAMGLETICRRGNRAAEALRYATLARHCWRNAEVRVFDALAAVISAPPKPMTNPITTAGGSN